MPQVVEVPSHQLTWVCAQTPVERLLSSWLVGIFFLTTFLGSVVPLDSPTDSGWCHLDVTIGTCPKGFGLWMVFSAYLLSWLAF